MTHAVSTCDSLENGSGEELDSISWYKAVVSKRPDDRADYCLDCSFLPSASIKYSFLHLSEVEWSAPYALHNVRPQLSFFFSFPQCYSLFISSKSANANNAASSGSVGTRRNDGSNISLPARLRCIKSARLKCSFGCLCFLCLWRFFLSLPDKKAFCRKTLNLPNNH